MTDEEFRETLGTVSNAVCDELYKESLDSGFIPNKEMFEQGFINALWGRMYPVPQGITDAPMPEKVLACLIARGANRKSIVYSGNWFRIRLQNMEVRIYRNVGGMKDLNYGISFGSFGCCSIYGTPEKVAENILDFASRYSEIREASSKAFTELSKKLMARKINRRTIQSLSDTVLGRAGLTSYSCKEEADGRILVKAQIVEERQVMVTVPMENLKASLEKVLEEVRSKEPRVIKMGKHSANSIWDVIAF